MMSEQSTKELESIDLPTRTATEPTVDDDVDALLNDLESPVKAPQVESTEEGTTETAAEEDPNDPINKVKVSASRLAASLGLLTKDIDDKFGISATAKRIDEKIHATERTKHALEVVSTTASDIDQKFHVSETTRSTANVVGSSSAAQGIKNTIGGVWEGAGNGLRQFNERHSLTEKGANFVVSTADFLNSKINPSAADSVTVPDKNLAAALNVKEDETDFPSSFQKD